MLPLLQGEGAAGPLGLRRYSAAILITGSISASTSSDRWHLI